MSLLSQSKKYLLESFLVRMQGLDNKQVSSLLNVNLDTLIYNHSYLLIHPNGVLGILEEIQSYLKKPSVNLQISIIRNIVKQFKIKAISFFEIKNKQLKAIYNYSNMPETICLEKDLKIKDVNSVDDILSPLEQKILFGDVAVFFFNFKKMIVFGYYVEDKYFVDTNNMYLENLLSLLFILEQMDKSIK